MLEEGRSFCKANFSCFCLFGRLYVLTHFFELLKVRIFEFYASINQKTGFCIFDLPQSFLNLVRQ